MHPRLLTFCSCRASRPPAADPAMKPILETSAAIALFLVFGACANTAHRTTEPRPNRDTITREQLVENRFATAYEAVAALRSNWLSTHGPNSFHTPSQVLVYYDNVRLGGVDAMRAVNISPISYIQHFDGIAATERWGVDHGAGVILISTRPIGTRTTR